MVLMLYICTVIALLCTFLWINITIADIINIKLNPYASGKEDEVDNKTAIVKNILSLLMAIFWGVVIIFV